MLPNHTLAPPKFGRCLFAVFATPWLALATLLGSGFMFSACNGLFEGIYDTPPSENTTPQRGFLSYDAATHRGRIFVDATSYQHWVYLDLPTRTTHTLPIPTTLSGAWDGQSAISYQHVTWPSTFRTDSLIRTDAMPQPERWTIALHHYDVATNGGEALATNFRSINELMAHREEIPALVQQAFTPDAWTTHQGYYDLTGIFRFYIGYQHAAFNEVLSTWMDMDVKNPPPRYTLSQRVYLLRLKDGSMAALHFPSHVNVSGQKGFVTIDYLWPL